MIPNWPEMTRSVKPQAPALIQPFDLVGGQISFFYREECIRHAISLVRNTELY